MEEEIKNQELENVEGQEENSFFNLQTIIQTLILNWKWFVLSVIICLGAAAICLRYTPRIYQSFAKLLIKEEETRRGRSSLLYSSNLGMMSNSTGIDNEMEILSSLNLAEQTVKDLKLYVKYTSEGRVRDMVIYKSQPISVDLDPAHLDKLRSPISMVIQRVGNTYHVTGSYNSPVEGRGWQTTNIDKKISQLPSTIVTKVGILSFINENAESMKDGQSFKVSILPPKSVAAGYRGAFSVAQNNKTTSIALLGVKDEVPTRASDYLKQLVICYNRQANMDKNEVARNTEAFINSRLEKISEELGATEGQLESYKKRNRMVDQAMNAGQAMQNANEYDQKLAEANTQVALLNSVQESMSQPSNQYQTLPANVGISDPTVNGLINKYNEIALERKKLLRSASETSPTVTPLTSQLDDLNNSIHRAMAQAKKGLQIQRNNVASQYGKYQGQLTASPEQERMLTQIGRQQDVKSGLYLMLLQKREENSISLAATADKGILIDEPANGGQVSPKRQLIFLIALLLGLGIPALILFLINFFRYRIEGHDDVARLTKLPILGDVAVASDTAKTKADIVVHENQNNQMEEIFRSMRTNLQFMLKENQKVILFTSSTSGEGKTFNASNLAVSFALLGKKVILVGLDIRKPRLAELFEINDHHHGITMLLTKEQPDWEEIKSQILPSGVNNNLDLLLSGPIPPNPAELIARPSLDIIINHLKEKYDYILIDTAPVGLVTDTLQIGRVADATVYMCRADYTPKESFGLINSLAIEKKLPNMSIVINGIDMSKKKYGYYYGYGRYGKYGRFGRYGGKYGKYGSYGHYGNYGSYGNYANSHYGDKNDTSIKR
ncbi:capsid assembly protein [Hoylesella buccalis]|uniref:non-specific protein-tyrosine kinase n=1 Tax=Hoylesella buccalis TaxID=28127 RepID=A0A2N6QS36_9BACT|nr:polysaccharide biosynthesis tyrosine autokinase [Hoylesella buccalis]PMC24726.1 capsid assembly protein [Hoylesella buccalis]